MVTAGRFTVQLEPNDAAAAAYPCRPAPAQHLTASSAMQSDQADAIARFRPALEHGHRLAGATSRTSSSLITRRKEQRRLPAVSLLWLCSGQSMTSKIQQQECTSGHKNGAQMSDGGSRQSLLSKPDCHSGACSIQGRIVQVAGRSCCLVKKGTLYCCMSFEVF